MVTRGWWDRRPNWHRQSRPVVDLPTWKSALVQFRGANPHGRGLRHVYYGEPERPGGWCSRRDLAGSPPEERGAQWRTRRDTAHTHFGFARATSSYVSSSPSAWRTVTRLPTMARPSGCTTYASRSTRRKFSRRRTARCRSPAASTVSASGSPLAAYSCAMAWSAASGFAAAPLPFRGGARARPASRASQAAIGAVRVSYGYPGHDHLAGCAHGRPDDDSSP